MTTIQARLVRLVRDGMHEKRYSQVVLAGLTGMTEKHLSAMLNGKAQGSFAAWESLLKAVGKEL